MRYTQALPEAAAELGSDNIGMVVFNIIGALGGIAAIVCASLYNAERKSTGDLESEAVLMRSKVDDKENEIRRASLKLEEEKQTAAVAVSEAELYKRRYNEAAKEIFKLERALEMKVRKNLMHAPVSP